MLSRIPIYPECMEAKPIVIGYDGSDSGGHALRWALDEGTRRGLPVHVVHIVEWPVTVMPGGTGWLTGEQYAMARKDIDEAIADAGGGSAAEVSIVEGSIVGTLCNLSADASMIVLGARGRGGFSGLMIGSVGLSVTVHAKCPVVVVRGEGHADAAAMPVVVGVDESPQAEKALEFALTEAELRGSAVLAVRAWRPPRGVRDPDELQAAEHHALREFIAPCQRRHPKVLISGRLVSGRAAPILIEASEQAQLIVVGSRGTGGFKDLLLGSVGQQLLHHAACPVAVVR